jgi:hypothetical protein
MQMFPNRGEIKMTPPVSPLDLTTLANLKGSSTYNGWIASQGLSTTTIDDSVLQSCITAWGYEFLTRTGLGDQNGDFQQSPFNQVCSFNETGSVGGITLSTTEKPLQTQEQRDDPAKKKQKPKYCIHRLRQE